MERPSELSVGLVPAWDRPLVLVPVFAAVSLIGGAFASFSWEANAWVVLVGGVIAWLGLTNRVGKRSAPDRLGRDGLWWLVPVAVLISVELTNFLLGSTYDHPTLSLLADPLLEGYIARSIGYFAWVTAFWGLIRR
jgi:hypothetical protein